MSEAGAGAGGRLVAVPLPEPNAEIVEVAEAILRDARAGRVVSFAFAATMMEGATVSGVVYGRGHWMVGVLGELEIVKGRILEYLRDVNDGEL